MIEQIEQAIIETGEILLHAENITDFTHTKDGAANFVTEYDTQVQKILFSKLIYLCSLQNKKFRL